MAKKGLLVLVLAAIVAGGAFAQDVALSAGIGGTFAASFDSIFDKDNSFDYRTVGGGFFAFFDATYAVAEVGMLFGGLQYGTDGKIEDDPTIDVSYLTLGLFGKFPIELEGFTLFPLLGVQIDLGLSAKNEGDDITTDTKILSEMLDRFWIKLGVGADFNLSDSIYLRPLFLWGLNFGTQNLRDYLDLVKVFNSDVAGFYHGLEFRLAVGFKF